MTQHLPKDLQGSITDLEAQIRAMGPDQRVELQQDLHRLCDKLEREGYDVPDRLRALDRILAETMVEALFDNLPV